jgi:hypothetical protein
MRPRGARVPQAHAESNGNAIVTVNRCLGDNCPYSAQIGPVGSRQLRLGGVSVQCGLVGCSKAWWNDHENDRPGRRPMPRRRIVPTPGPDDHQRPDPGSTIISITKVVLTELPSPSPPLPHQKVGCDPARQRSDRKAARMSVEKSSGSSQAAKWPPLSTSWK